MKKTKIINHFLVFFLPIIGETTTKIIKKNNDLFNSLTGFKMLLEKVLRLKTVAECPMEKKIVYKYTHTKNP